MRWYFKIEDRNQVLTDINDPIGWDGMGFSLDRDRKRHGVMFMYQANEFEYIGVAATLLKEEYETYGSEGQMLLRLYYDCGNGLEELEAGKFDFTAWDDKFGSECSVKLPIEQIGHRMTLWNRMDQKVNMESGVAFDGVTAMVGYANLPLITTLPGKSIYVEDNSINDNDIAEPYQGNFTDDSGSPLSQQQQDYIVPAFDHVISSEIGGYAHPSGMIEEYDEVIGSVSPAGIDLPYELVVGGLTSKVDLDRIEPIVNYSQELGNTFGQLPFNNLTIDISIPFMEIATREVSPGDPSTTGLLYWCFYCGIRRGDPAHTSNPDGVDWISTSAASWAVYQAASPPPAPLPSGTSTAKSWTETGITLYPGDRIYFFYVIGYRKFDVHQLQPAFDITYGEDSYFKLSGLSTLPDTTCKVFLINEALSRISEAVTDDEIRVYSEYFGRTDSEPYAAPADGCGSLESITSGLFIRQTQTRLPTRPPLFNISMENIWSGLNPIHNIGMGFEDDPNRAGHDVLRIEPWDYFYTTDIMLECLNIDEVNRKISKEDIYSIFKFGYGTWEAEEFNGIDEFLTMREYRTTLREISNTLDQISTFVASGFALEVTRRKGNIDSKDWRYDNETFIICMERDGSDIIPEVGGITDPDHIIDPDTIYNFRIRPIYNAMRWLPTVLASYRIADTSSKIIFTNGEGNYYAEGRPASSFCRISNVVLSEKDDVRPADMVTPSDGLPINFAEEIVFDYPLSVSDYKAIKADPRGLIRYQTDGIDGYGWLRSLKYKPNDGLANFTLITQRT